MSALSAATSASLWHNADFRRLWIGQAISEIGSRITREGVPLTAVLLLGAGPLQMSLLTVTSAAAVFLVGLVAGVWIDRVRRRPVLIWADVLRALTLFSIPAAWWASVLRMEQLIAVAGLQGVLNVFFQVAYQSWLPWLVHRSYILEANSKMAVAQSVAEIAGPGLTGVLVQLLSAPVAIFWDAVSFIWSALWIARIRRSEPPLRPRGRLELRRDVEAGVRAIIRDPVLRIFALRAATQYYFFGFFSTLYVLYAIRMLKLTPVALGIAIATGGVSALMAAFFAPRLVGFFGLGHVIRGSALLFGLAGFFLPAARGSLWTATGFMMAQQAGDIFWSLLSITETSYRQSLVPDELLGRVNSCMHLATQGIWPLGAFTAGLLAESWGVCPVLWIGAVGGLASALWVLHPAIGRLQQRELNAREAAV